MARVRICDDRVEDAAVLIPGIIWSLIRKPGAFRLFKYPEDLFPRLTFRRAYDALCKTEDDRRGSLECLRILHLSASATESEAA
jgi:hypothetical protein